MDNCMNCGADLTHLEGRKKKKFCDTTCRTSYWFKHAPKKEKKQKIMLVSDGEGNFIDKSGVKWVVETAKIVKTEEEKPKAEIKLTKSNESGRSDEKLPVANEDFSNRLGGRSEITDNTAKKKTFEDHKEAVKGMTPMEKVNYKKEHGLSGTKYRGL